MYVKIFDVNKIKTKIAREGVIKVRVSNRGEYSLNRAVQTNNTCFKFHCCHFLGILFNILPIKNRNN
jgi:hypothetical protein